MASIKYQFKYMPLVGKLPGKSMAEQTEQAINEIAEIVNDNTAQAEIINTLAEEANANSVEALEKATEALETSGRVYITKPNAVNLNDFCESELLYIGSTNSTNLPVASKGFLEVKTNDDKTEATQVFTADGSDTIYVRSGAITASTVGDVTTYAATYGSWVQIAKRSEIVDTPVSTTSTNSTSTSYSVSVPLEKVFANFNKIEGHTVVDGDALVSATVTKVVSKDSNNNVIATMPIPSAIQSLTGYGWSCPSYTNYIDFANKKFVQNVGSRAYTAGDENDSTVITDGSTTTYYHLTPAVETDISDILGATGIACSASGTLTFENANSLSVPYDLEWVDGTDGLMTAQDKEKLETAYNAVNSPLPYLPLSGGQLKGDIGFISTGATTITKDDRTTYMEINNGSYLTLWGSNSSYPGKFTLSTNDGTNLYKLEGWNNGNLTWRSRPVLTSNVPESRYSHWGGGSQENRIVYQASLSGDSCHFLDVFIARSGGTSVACKIVIKTFNKILNIMESFGDTLNGLSNDTLYAKIEDNVLTVYYHATAYEKSYFIGMYAGSASLNTNVIGNSVSSIPSGTTGVTRRT